MWCEVLIDHGGAYGSLNVGQSTIASQTRKQDAVFRPSDNGTSNGTNDSLNEGLAQNLQYIDAARAPSLEYSVVKQQTNKKKWK